MHSPQQSEECFLRRCCHYLTAIVEVFELCGAIVVLMDAVGLTSRVWSATRR